MTLKQLNLVILLQSVLHQEEKIQREDVKGNVKYVQNVKNRKYRSVAIVDKNVRHFVVEIAKDWLNVMKERDTVIYTKFS